MSLWPRVAKALAVAQPVEEFGFYIHADRVRCHFERFENV
jgi:hypothetical protein